MDIIESAPVSDLCGDYLDPVRQLLAVGAPRKHDPAEWPDYAARFGIGDEHIGALIRMACDPRLNRSAADSFSAWAPVHAWRALGQLRAEAAVAPLLALMTALEDDYAADQELPEVFGLIGPAAIPPIAAFVADRSNPTFPVATALGGLKEIAARNPACRSDCIDILVRTLEPRPEADPMLAGFAVSSLLDLAAVETIDAIRAAFARDAVDLSVAGDVEDVEIELGLRERRATPAPRYQISLPDLFEPPTPDFTWREPPAPRRVEKIGRNAPCPCGSGKKYKKCCLP